ncbi:MAG: PilW family protein [Chlamydiota bacterium]
MKRKYSTLIEVIIAMALVSILMTSLLGFYSYMTRTNSYVTKLSRQAFRMRYAQQRLSYVIEHANLDKKIRPREDSNSYQDNITVFYTTDNESSVIKGPSLVFSFDNGVDIAPEFSNGVLGRLYLDHQDNLCLAFWPLPHQEQAEQILPMRREILLAGVSDLHFSFYAPPLEEGSDQHVDPPDHDTGRGDMQPLPDTWHSDEQGWLPEYKVLPALMTLSVVMKDSGERETFYFQLPHCKERIYFR